MALIMEKPTAAFDMSQIKRGDLLWGKHCTWNEGKEGFITTATEQQLIVQYYPGIGNVTNHFVIPVSEVIDGQWEIRWSTDMIEIKEYRVETDKEQQETEGVEDNDIRRTDL